MAGDIVCDPRGARCSTKRLTSPLGPRVNPGPDEPLVKAITNAGDPGMSPSGVIRMDWRHEAACRDEDPELFFPIGNTGPALVQIEEAKAVCRRCSVVDECLRWALETGQDAGVWGGLSEDERRALKRRNARMRARSSA